ncbi:MLP-like protein 328 [Eucalyptus grandis]|uniref:MLP-like protein 328 n=1 Tax=Eucalyptus grandis TaxID=71139 RepID=UPI00192EB5A3|nr:MLP-like protein 328 [Eucalyptus grandis]
MAQLVKVEAQVELESPAEKVFDIFRRKSYLFPEIAPHVVKDVKLVSGDWDSVGSVWLWTQCCWSNLVARGYACIKLVVNFSNPSIKWRLTEMEPYGNKRSGDEFYKSLKSSLQFSPEGERCMAKAVLTYEKQNADVPDANKYLEFTRSLLISVDGYLLKA